MSLASSALTLVRWLGPWESSGVPQTVERRTHQLGDVRTYVYETSAPGHGRPKSEGVWVLAPGLHFLGPDDPRLDRFCRILAASGTTVVAPFLRDHVALRVSERSTEDLATAFDYGESLAHDAGLPRPALFSISFGSQPAIALAARETHRDRVGALVLFGGFADFDVTVRFCITGLSQRGDASLSMTHDPLNAPVVWLHLLDHLELPCDRERVAAAWRTMVHRTWGKMELKAPGARDPIAHEIASTLEPRDRAVFLLGCGLALAHPNEASDHLETALGRTNGHYRFTDPRPHLAKVRAPIAVVHGRDDDVIPWFEAEKLREALPADVATRVMITGLYGHTGAAAVSPRALVRELSNMTAVVRTLAEAPRGRFGRAR